MLYYDTQANEQTGLIDAVVQRHDSRKARTLVAPVAEERLGEVPYLGGSEFSIADIAWLPWARFLPVMLGAVGPEKFPRSRIGQPGCPRGLSSSRHSLQSMR